MTYNEQCVRNEESKALSSLRMMSHNRLCLTLSSDYPTQFTATNFRRNDLLCFPVSQRITPHKSFSPFTGILSENFNSDSSQAVTTKDPAANAASLNHRLTSFFQRGTDSKYLGFAGHVVSIITTKFCSCSTNIERTVRLCSHKTLFMDTEI